MGKEKVNAAGALEYAIENFDICEKCLANMVRRRVIADGKPKIVMQCVRCRFWHEIDKD